MIMKRKLRFLFPILCLCVLAFAGCGEKANYGDEYDPDDGEKTEEEQEFESLIASERKLFMKSRERFTSMKTSKLLLINLKTVSRPENGLIAQ